MLTLTLVAFSSGVLCNAEQNLTDTVIQSFDPMEIMNNTENVYSASEDLELMNQTSTSNYANICCTGSIGQPTHKLHKRPMQWNEARKSCMSEGGQLVVINSDEEGTMLVNWMIRENIYSTWVGAHDLFNTYDWVTMSGESLEAAGYDNWLRGEPNNANGIEHCGSLETSGGLNDLRCDTRLSYFCKIYVC